MEPVHFSDWELSRRAVSDDRAFEEIVQRHSRLVYNIALRCAGTTEDAGDIAQEAFLKAWRSLPSFRGDCALSTWLCRIALSCAFDFARSKKRHATLSLTLPDADGEEERTVDVPETDVTCLPEEEAIRKVEIDAVRRAIDALPEEQRLIVTLRDMGGMPYADIAELLGLELGTVKSRLHRARAAIREFLIEGNFFSRPPSNEAKKDIICAKSERIAENKAGNV